VPPVALTIAGSDPSGGAGIQADLKTFHRFGVYGAAAITLLTVQNTQRVSRVEMLPPALVLAQIDAVLEDIPPQAAKTGALGNAGIIAAVARPYPFPLVVDPVMISKHGAPLIDPEARAALKELLLPRAFLVTPNLPEAAALAGFPVEDAAAMRRAAEAIRACGARNVLVKGGHLAGAALDLLLEEGGECTELAVPRIRTPHTHGTGCTYSAAIAAGLAQALPLAEAVRRAKRFVTEAIRTNPGLGRGSGPVNHFAGY
jgi:hydroxymethylpyrimidine/phosphomethylpyrimidine kinase